MKVMTLAPIFGGGIPLVEDIIEAMEDLGVDVLQVNDESWVNAYQEAARTRNPAPFYAKVHKALEEQAEQARPDLCLTFALAPLPPQFRAKIGALGIRSVHWFFEDGRRFPIFERMAQEHDAIFAIQPWVTARLRELGHQNAHYLPLGVPPRCQLVSTKRSSNPAYRIAFVGTPSARRIELFRDLLDLGVNLWGPGWSEADAGFSSVARAEGRWQSRDEELEIYLNSELVVNIHEGSGLHGSPDFVNPRTFVLAALGVPQILEDRLELAPLFDLTQELTVFKQGDSVRERVLQALENPELLERKALKAQARALENHRLQHRITQLLELPGPS